MLDIYLQVWQIENMSCFPVEKVKEKQGKMLRTAQRELCLPRYAGHTLGRPIPETNHTPNFDKVDLVPEA